MEKKLWFTFLNCYFLLYFERPVSTHITAVWALYIQKKAGNKLNLSLKKEKKTQPNKWKNPNKLFHESGNIPGNPTYSQMYQYRY